jgi:hypothetical protein
MKLRDHVLYAIDDFQAGKNDPAFLHACMAIEPVGEPMCWRL